ncbi:hypothetical protein ElyMa_003924300 [Elysia marginata]|uniref:Uncharacterized protein n=1 Tax=Elysia marginata TaxID=1093978 RepID=A0AAV4FRF1_9GAST|nr:hypothetical protein ElyMa_003924300 [Elysia marginata]
MWSDSPSISLATLQEPDTLKNMDYSLPPPKAVSRLHNPPTNILQISSTAYSQVPILQGQRGGVICASDSRPGGRGFYPRPCHVAITLGKQFTLTFPRLPTSKMGTQLQASNVLVCWGISGAALVATQLR